MSSLMVEDGLASLRYHWFGNTWDGISAKELSKRVSILDWAGYDSVLLPYHNMFGDNFIRAARAVNEFEKIKYNIALRTTSLSPEYCAMMCYAFHSIAPNRLMLNLLTGTPEAIENRGQINSDRDTLRKQLNEFVVDLKDNPLFKKTNTQIMISGNSPEILKIAYDHADFTSTNPLSIEREDVLSDTKMGQLNAPRLTATTDICIFDTEEEAKQFERIYGSHQSIVGTRQFVTNRLLELQRQGITDVLIGQHPADKDISKTHDFIYDLVQTRLFA